MAPSITNPPQVRIPLATFRTPKARQEFTLRYRENQGLWPVPYEEKRVKTSFGVTNIMISGEKSAPSVVLLHGFLNTPLMWRFNIEELSRHYRVYMPEVMGDAGLSLYRQIALNPDNWSRWLIELYGYFDLETPRLAGFSLGAWHGARFSLNNPERVSSLILLSPVPLFRMVPIHLLREGVTTTLSEKRPDIRRLIGKQYAAQFYPDKAYELLQYASITGYLPNLPAFPREFIPSEWKRLPEKTLIITGDEEIYFDPGDAQKIAHKYFPIDQFVMLEETGHSVSIERPDKVNRLMLDFWRS